MFVEKSKVFKMSLTERRMENSGKTSWKCVTNTQFWFLIWLSPNTNPALSLLAAVFPHARTNKHISFIHYSCSRCCHRRVCKMLKPLRDERKLRNLDVLQSNSTAVAIACWIVWHETVMSSRTLFWFLSNHVTLASACRSLMLFITFKSSTLECDHIRKFKTVNRADFWTKSQKFKFNFSSCEHMGHPCQLCLTLFFS